MGLFKDAGDSIIKYSEIIVNKTEGYTKIAKLALDVRKLESDVNRKKTELGNHVFNRLQHEAFDINQDNKVTSIISSIIALQNKIAIKKEELEQLKHSDNSAKPPSSIDKN